MENQTHRNVLMEHEMVVDGVILCESKEQHYAINDQSGQAEQILKHSRWIGDKKYTVKQTVFDGEVIFEAVDTNIDDDQIEEFKQEWEEKWQPSLGPGRIQ